MKKIKPIGKRIIVAPSVSKIRGNIFIPDYLSGSSSNVTVVDFSEGVSIPIKKGDELLVENGISRGLTIDGTNHFVIEEHNIFALIRHKKILPFGKKLLLKRETAEVNLGSIVLPENRRTQSLAGKVIGFGVYRGLSNIGLTMGDHVLLKEWDNHFVEVNLKDGSFGMIVNQSDVICKVEQGSSLVHNGMLYKF